MASTVQICNLALARIGQTSIASLDDTNPNAAWCKLLYEPVRDAVLQSFPWNFATCREALADLGAPATNDWSSMYALPAGCLKAWRILPAVKGGPAPAFERALVKDGSGNRVPVILTDQANAVLLFTVRVTDPNLYTPLFIQALADRLGAELAMPITKDRAIQQACLTLFQNDLLQARTADGSEGTQDDPALPDWIRVRGISEDRSLG